MPRRRAWNGDPPATPEAARRRLVEVARECVERLGLQKAGLSDVAEAAGVTRQTVYRYFTSTEDLFHSAAALSSGGFYERLHERAARRRTLSARLTECLVFAILEVPRDPHLGALVRGGEHFTVEAALRLGFVQDEIRRLAGGDAACPLTPGDVDAIAELLVRLLLSFLFNPGEPRDEAALRAFLLPIVEPCVRSREASAGTPSRRRRPSRAAT